MKLLVYTNLYYPDQIAGASLYTDMTMFFKNIGYDVRVVSTFSYYPAWKIREDDKGVWFRNGVFREIVLKRVKMWIPRKPTGLTRMISDFSFLFSLVIFGRFKNWKPDVILTAEPMLSQCLAQKFIYPFSRIPRLIIVQDFVVDAALELGMLKLPGISHLLRSLERWALRSAKTLTTISKPMLNKLEGIIGKDRRLEYIPNWIHGSLEEEITRARSDVNREPGILFYSGNVGMKQGLPQFLDDFEKCGASDWKIDIHGGGANIENLRQTAEGKGWIKLGELLDEPEYVRKLLSVSACLITQQPGVTANFLPSKLLPALATGTPVLAVCDADSPLGVEVIQSKCGVVIRLGDVEGLKRVLQEWQEQPELLATYSQNARIHAKKFNREVVLKQFEDELFRLIENEPAKLKKQSI